MNALDGKWLVMTNSAVGHLYYVAPDGEENIWFWGTGLNSEAEAKAVAERLNAKKFCREYGAGEWWVNDPDDKHNDALRERD